MTTPTGPYRLLITAGPTHEPIDAVRYLANRSSGKLGIEIATAAAARGLQVTLLLGPVSTAPPEGTSLEILRFRASGDLQDMLERTFKDHDVLIMAAAVADYRPTKTRGGKLSRTDAVLSLELEPVPDLVAHLGQHRRPDQLVVGFALEEASNLADRARTKLDRKGLDAIVANPLETMNSTSIDATVYMRDGSLRTPGETISKRAFAGWLLDLVEEMRG